MIDNNKLIGENIGKAIAKLLKEKGMSQGDVARNSGLERSYVSAIVVGKIKYLRLYTIDKIAKSFNMSTVEFISYVLDHDQRGKDV